MGVYCEVIRRLRTCRLSVQFCDGNYSPAFDFLRSTLVCLVFFCHAQAIYFANNLDVVARLAVLILFCLAGYLAAASIRNNIMRNGRLSIYEYAYGKCIRLAPMIVVTTCIFAGIYSLLDVFSIPTVTFAFVKPVIFKVHWWLQFESLLTLTLSGDLTGNMSGDVASNGPLWFITALLRCYIVLGLVVFLCYGQPRLPFKFAAFVVLYLFIVKSFDLRSHNPQLNVYHVSYACFLLGVGAFICRHTIWALKQGFFTLAFVIFLTTYWQSGSWGDCNQFLPLVWQIAVGSGVVLLLPSLSQLVLQRKYIEPIVKLNAISYPVYVMHQPLSFVLALMFSHFAFIEGLYYKWIYLGVTVIVTYALVWGFYKVQAVAIALKS